MLQVAKNKSVVNNPDEPADPKRGGEFAEWAMLTLHALRIELDKSYRVAVELLSEIPRCPRRYWPHTIASLHRSTHVVWLYSNEDLAMPPSIRPTLTATNRRARVASPRTGAEHITRTSHPCLSSQIVAPVNGTQSQRKPQTNR